ncbi:retinal G protein coupled receptor b-like [Scleropages formosus]|uniref:RPE-retinal G protein-coupled receptor n=1 Tax=Scleropages formosus TaxID=113540 RepID=A0A0P7UK57_SCLFO|nr:RPE-retinal G protein-coupled receptor-like [Scleropages formosus]KPP74749.1 retinal G protein coupled receptor b-like [Scleropages formosus]
METSYTLPEGFTDFDMFAFGSVLLVEGLLGFFLNAMAIIAYLSVKELRTPNNFFVFNLAVADIGLNINGLVAAYACYLRHWPYGPEGCQIHAFQGMVAALASITLLGAIAWDRYHLYCTKQELPWPTAVTMVVIVWVLAVFWSSLPLKGWGVYDFEPLGTCCTLDYSKGDRNYTTYMLSLVFFFLLIPALTMQSSYECIYRYFKKTRKYKFNTSLPLLTLMFCWGPYILLCLYSTVKDVTVVSPKLRMMLPVLAKSSPAFHSMLYAFGSESYRAGIWQFLTGQRVSGPESNKKK